MLRLHLLFLLAALAGSLAPALSPAQESGHERANVESAAREGVLKLLPADSVTEHELTIGGRKIAYTKVRRERIPAGPAIPWSPTTLT